VDTEGAEREVAAGAGSAEALADSDLVVRRLHTWDDDLGIPSLSFATASFLRGKAAEAEEQRVERWVNYYGPPHFLPSVSYAEALDPTVVEDRFFRDKVVFSNLVQPTAIAFASAETLLHMKEADLIGQGLGDAFLCSIRSLGLIDQLGLSNPRQQDGELGWSPCKF
jgi:hypothetical protein